MEFAYVAYTRERKIVRGKVGISEDTLKKLSDTIGVPVNRLVVDEKRA